MAVIAVPDDIIERCLNAAEIHSSYFKSADNTVILDGSHIAGMQRGFVGEWAVSKWLGVDCAALKRLPGQDKGCDVVTRDGAKIDVKTSRPGYPLMVPQRQAYKIDPLRADWFLLVWWQLGDPEAEIVGRVATVEMQKHVRRGMKGDTVGAAHFTCETLWIPSDELERL